MHFLQPKVCHPLLDMGPPVPEAANCTLNISPTVNLTSLHPTNASKGSVITPRPCGQARKIFLENELFSKSNYVSKFLSAK